MNYPELIWRLVEMLLEKENNNIQLNAKKQDETT